MAEDIPVTGPGTTPGQVGPGVGPYPAGWRTGLPPYEGVVAGGVRRVSWGAIFAGLAVALVTELALSTLGLAIGFGSFNPTTQAQPFSGFGTGASVWMAITTFLALFFGGMCAARLAGLPRRSDGVLHGVVTWALATLLSAWMLTSVAGSLISGAVGVVGGALGLVGQGVSAIAPAAVGAAGEQLQQQGINTSAIGAEVERFLRQTGDPALQPEALRRRAAQAGQTVERAAGEAAQQPQTAGQDVTAALARLVAQGKGVINQVDRQDAINVIMARTGKSEAEASQIVDNWVNTWNQFTAQVSQTAQQAGQTATQAAEDVSSALGKVAAWAFVSMVVGVLAAAWGGSLGIAKEAVVSAVAAVTPTTTISEH